MASSWTAFFLFMTALFSAGCLPQEEDPLVTKVKQIVADVNTYLKENKQDQVRLPDYGNFTADHMVLTNLTLSDFSTMEFTRGPCVEQNQTLSTFNVTLGLQRFNYQFDFAMDSPDFQQQGHVTLTPQGNFYLIEGIVEIYDNKSCRANLTEIDFNDYGEMHVDIQPDNIPNRNEIIEKIFSFMSPGFILWSIKALEMITSIPSFDEQISNIICQVLVS